MMDVSIVVVSYNVRDLLKQCLRSLESIRLSCQVIVVDNASADGSAGMVREEFPSACLIENAENRGFAAANNQGFARAQGRYVLMLNPDTAVREGAVETLVRFMDQHPQAGACGGRLYYGDGTPQHSAFAFPTLAQIVLDFFPLNWRLTNSRLNGRYPREWYARGEPFQVGHLLGADLMVRRRAVEQVGWLDEGFFIYCEEIDWCMRLRRAGWQVWCVPQAEIVHHEAQSTRQFRDQMFVELWRARFRLFEKHYSPAFRLAARQLVRWGLWNAARKTRVGFQSGSVTEDEMNRRLGAYAEVARLSRSAR
jgi:GT2 family glycosyltransferase